MAKLEFILPKKINSQEPPSISKDTGRVISISDGVVRAEGLFDVQVGELVIFESGLRGQVLNLERDNVGVVLFGDDRFVKENVFVFETAIRKKIYHLNFRLNSWKQQNCGDGAGLKQK